MPGEAGPALDGQVLRFILQHFLDQGHPPTSNATSRALGRMEGEILGSHRRLQEGGALVLRRGDPGRIRIAHPFCALPTPFAITTPRGSWWALGAWDSLGLAALVSQDAAIMTRSAAIMTRSGAMGDPMTIVVRDGLVEEDGLLLHVMVPVAKWWDDVDAAWGTMLFFRDEAEVAAWCTRTGLPRGTAVPLSQAWAVAREWYGGLLREEARPKTPREIANALAAAGLHGPFWQHAGTDNHWPTNWPNSREDSR